MKRRVIRIRTKRPRIVGIGLVALDVVTAVDVETTYYAGGTCANVLTVLAYLGWRSLPVARLAHDSAATIVAGDLLKWKVNLSFLHIPPVAKTPVIVERLQKDIDGIPFHRFSFVCQGCNRRYPRFQAVPLKALRAFMPRLSNVDVLFVDRVSPGSVALAKRARDRGAIVFFEPPSASEEKNFRAILDVTTILKYSHAQIDEFDLSKSSVKLEIQTLGRGGLRFRTGLADFRNRWHHLDAEPKTDLADTAGAGDWLSAGIIHSLCANGERGLLKVKRDRLLQGFALGQALAAWNCGFVGARGGMYGESVKELVSLARSHALKSKGATERRHVVAEENQVPKICEGCQEAFKYVPGRSVSRRAS
jgi:sugar/nucleoside kinase (ribokinase family)